MARPIKAGLIGCGSVSIRGILPHLTMDDARERVELVAVCDVVETRAREAAQRFGIREYYQHSTDMIASSDIDLVLIATPIPYHFADTVRALEAGKHVYVQKTMTTNLADAQTVVNLARERNRTLVASPGQMLWPGNQQARELIRSGAIGKVYWAFGTTAGSHEYEPLRQGEGELAAIDPTWYYQLGGGPVYDMTVYMLHTLTGILGPVQRVSCMSGIGLPERRWRDKVIPVSMDDNTLMLLDFGNSLFAMAGGHNCQGGRLLRWGAMGFYGSGGSIETLDTEPGQRAALHLAGQAPDDLPHSANGPYIPNGDLPYVTKQHAAIQESHVYADIMHTAECIAEGRQPVPSGEHAAHVIEIIEKGYLAAKTGQTQAIESTF
ncbi:MAG TPA: Gfo/Idh/MocA family oxidoreductase [Roseiflexaceae bacterium]|nr:Gfo/Idh/MocA family oxidoreductase [Roseiflexaceae bacterium]